MNFQRTFSGRLIVMPLITGIFCISATANAQQYGGSGGSGGSGTGGGTSSGSYGNTGAIVGGVVGVVGGITAMLFYMRSKSFLTGCVGQGETPQVRLLQEKKGKRVWLLSNNTLALPVSERVRLHGKRRKNSSGELIFHHNRMLKSYGPCKIVAANLGKFGADTQDRQLRDQGFAKSE